MKANAVGKVYAEVDRAYLAGLIDGDGCIMATIERHGEKKFGFRVRVSIKITQKDQRLLVSLCRKYGIGNIKTNRQRTEKLTFDWIILDRNDVRLILDLIEPYTKAKGQQVALARQILGLSDATQQGLLKMARLADTLSKFNVRSKGRRKNFLAMIKV